MVIAIIVIAVVGFLLLIFFPQLFFSTFDSEAFWRSEQYTPRGQCCPEVAGNTGSLPWGDHRCDHDWAAGCEFPESFNGHGREEWEAEFSRERFGFRDRFRTCQTCGRVEQYLSTCTHWGF